MPIIAIIPVRFLISCLLSGLDWSGGKEGKLVKKPAPKIHCFEKTHKTHVKNNNFHFTEKKSPAGIPPS